MKTKTETGAIIIEGHIQGLSNTRALGEAGIPVYVVDTTDCVARYSKYCLKFFRCPDFHSDDFAIFLSKLAIEEGLQGWLLLPSNDHAVYTISRNSGELGMYYSLITPGLSVIENIYDKLRLIEIAKGIQVKAPLTFNPDLSENEVLNLPYPVITKGRNGLSFYKNTGRKAFIAHNMEEYKANIDRISSKAGDSEYFTQEVIPYRDYEKTVSVAAFSVRGELKSWWMGRKVREHPLRFGTATFCESVICEELLEPTRKLLRALSFTGVCEIEFLRDPRDGVYNLIEINARTWLWVGLARASGIDFAKITYDFVVGNSVNYNSDYAAGIKWSNYITDFAFSILAIMKGKLRLKDFIRSYSGTVIRAVFDRNDFKPSVIYFFSLFEYLRTR